MTDYPYIHALSTVGLIRHYNQDYIFNRIRTDFTGDSGTGKSMIADLLQLVFVGSSVFEAATTSIEEKRKPKGMVLFDQKRGIGGKGYIFLNIVVAESQYLIIGMYLEHSTNTVKPFVIHQGYDLNEPTFLNQSMFHDQFLDEDKILPLADLVEHLKKENLNCETLTLSAYHKFLFQRKILPFDLADNPDKLKTYALIIRSFSRGKGFKFDSQHLQDFLFGTDVEKAIKKNYDAQVENIRSAFTDSENYQKQIALLTDKKKDLQSLVELFGDRNELHKRHLNIQYEYYAGGIEEKKKLKATNHSKLSKVLIENLLLAQKDNEQQIKTINKEITNIKNFITSKRSNINIEQVEKKARHEYSKLRSIKDHLDAIRALLPEFNNSIEVIEKQYALQAQNGNKLKQLKDFENELGNLSILNDFKDSGWSKDYDGALTSYRKRLSELESEIVLNEALLKFSDFDNPTSLANWAINRTKEFSLEEESVLVQLKDLIVATPADSTEKYIPKPEELFDNIQYDLKNDDGFWLNLSGTFQFVSYVSQQFLNTSSIAQKKDFFKEKYTKADDSITKAKQEKAVIIRLHDRLHEISGLRSNIQLYQKKNAIENFEVLEPLSIEKEAFSKLLIKYHQGNQFEEEFQNAKGAWEKAYADLNEYQSVLKQFPDKEPNEVLEEKSSKLTGLTQQKSSMQRKLGHWSYFLKCSTEEFTNLNMQLEKEISNSSLTAVFGDNKRIETELWGARIRLKWEIRDFKKKVRSLEVEFTKHQIEFPLIVGEKLTSEEKIKTETEYKNAVHKYNHAIDVFIDKFLSKDKHRYKGEEDWRKLARGVLPEIFRGNEITEEQFSSEIDDRLQHIIDQNSLIGDRKIQLLIDVFNEVEVKFSQFSTEVDSLRRFFNENDKRITGGHKVTLKFAASADYPISWISTFKKQMRQESINRTGLFKTIDEGINFQEVIQRCFKQCGGKKVDPKIPDLLNPKNYFELGFSLQKDNIKNSGSTGQVYSAVALLCIARISLIEKDESGKRRKGVRFMPIDEAEGLGSNYEMLSNIAKKEDYQIISMSINPVGEFEEGSHYIYMLNEPEDESVPINGDPFAQFTEQEIAKNIQKFNVVSYDE